MSALNFSSSAAAVIATSTKLPKYHLPTTPLLLVSNSNKYKFQPTISHHSSSSSSSSKSDILTFLGEVRSTSSSNTPMAAAADSTSSTESRPSFSVLFVCLGNICRSPAAEGVFRSLVRKRGLDSRFLIDSAGTIGYHEGNLADPRMRAASKKRGIEITSISRPIKPSDFKDFDLILAMDRQNQEDILSAYERWSFKDTFPENAQRKVKLMCSYCKKHGESEVPDPYYGGPQGFEKVVDLLEDACESLLDSVLAENK